MGARQTLEDLRGVDLRARRRQEGRQEEKEEEKEEVKRGLVTEWGSPFCVWVHASQGCPTGLTGERVLPKGLHSSLHSFCTQRTDCCVASCTASCWANCT